MLTNRLRRGFAVVLSVSLLAAGTVTAFAAPGDDAWGEPPEGFTFEADNVGPTVYATPNTNSNTSGNTTNGNAAATEQVDYAAYADEIFQLVNEQRVANGLSEVERREDLDAVAAIRAAELAESFSHTRPNVESYHSLVDEHSITYTYVGENAGSVAATADAATMMSIWMNSEGHRDNILYPKHTGLGIGVYQVGQKVYCIQEFIY